MQFGLEHIDTDPKNDEFEAVPEEIFAVLVKHNTPLYALEHVFRSVTDLINVRLCITDSSVTEDEWKPSD